MPMPFRVLLVLLPLGACATGPLPPSARLPPDIVAPATDPMRAAILESAYVFNRESAPAAKARAAAMVEYLAADYAWNPRWSEYTPVAAQTLEAARAELRMTYVIAPAASPQAAVDGLLGISSAFALQRQPALDPAVFTDPALTLVRLTSPVDLPSTRNATAMIERDLHRIDTERFSGGGPGGQGGGGGAHP